MPIFDFECTKCHQTFELLVLGSSVPVCSSCGSEELTKLISAPAPHGKSAALIRSSRARAAKEGHFSNYSPSERPRSS